MALMAALCLAVAPPIGAEPQTMPDAKELEAQAAARFAQLALDCVHTEYPNKISHVMQGDTDARPPRALTPAFYGCFDWHSSVHGHWLLARLSRLYPDADFSGATPRHIVYVRDGNDHKLYVDGVLTTSTTFAGQ